MTGNGSLNQPFNVLFLCTGNSARSILAEAIMNHVGGGRFRAWSAGSHPAGKVHPHALQLLQRLGISAGEARSKSWDEFAQPGAPRMDFIFTVCGNAAGELCPVWPGQPVTAHWGVEDPAAVEGEPQKTNAFRQAFNVLEHRIRAFASLPLATLDRQRLTAHVHDIGRTTPDG
jgi:protein-tyrosine-phosphatase